MALSFHTIGVYTAISISAVTLYTLLRLAIPHNILLILLFLASIFVYECLKIRYSLPPHTKGPTYYYPLAVLLLLAGEAAELLVLWHGPKGNARDQIIRRSLVHASLAWNLVAEAEWWRSTFVCSHLNLPTCQCEKKLANVRLQHPSRWFEKSAIPSSTPIFHLFRRLKGWKFWVAVSYVQGVVVLIHATVIAIGMQLCAYLLYSCLGPTSVFEFFFPAKWDGDTVVFLIWYMVDICLIHPFQVVSKTVSYFVLE